MNGVNLSKVFPSDERERQTFLTKDFKIPNPCKIKQNKFFDTLIDYNPDEHD